MTVNRLRQELTEAEFIYWAAYFENKVEEEKREAERAKARRR
jgi:hypothetical protein